MADFQTLDLGRILQTAETIKGMRAQAETDKLRNAYLNTQIAGAQQQQSIQAQQAAVEKETMLARRQYYTAQAALNSADPKGTIEALAPDAVKAWEAQHGPGSWQMLTPEQAHAVAQAVQQKAESIIGPQQKVKWIDAGGQQIPVDEATGQPIRGAAPIAKSATPDAMLSSQTSLATNAATNATSRANAALAADTSRVTNAATNATAQRGQDLTAETARRGQDITAATATGKATDNERAAANYLGRMQAAEKLLGNYQPSTKDFAAALTLYGSDAGGLKSTVANSVMSDQGQKYYQAAADWVRAKLRKESGAVISPAEMAQEIRTYFPVPGDNAQTIAQKTAARAQASEGMRQMAGPAVTSSAGKVIDFSALPK